MTPQRDVYARLASERMSWMNDDQRRRMQDIADRLGRGLDEIDSCIARTAVMADEIAQVMQESLAENLYHVADGDGLFAKYVLNRVVWRQSWGIPGGEYHYGFTTFCVMLVVLIGGVAWWLHRSKWL